MLSFYPIFDWGDTLMRDDPHQPGPMYLWDHIELIEGVQDCLEILSKQFVLSVATNAGGSNEEAVRKAFKRIDIEKYFTHFFTSKEIGFEKPDTRFFYAIHQRLKVAPANCIMIGNLYEKDVVGAFNSGMKTIFFNENELQGDFVMANEICTQFKDVYNAIIRIST